MNNPPISKDLKGDSPRAFSWKLFPVPPHRECLAVPVNFNFYCGYNAEGASQVALVVKNLAANAGDM